MNSGRKEFKGVSLLATLLSVGTTQLFLYNQNFMPIIVIGMFIGTYWAFCAILGGIWGIILGFSDKS